MNAKERHAREALILNLLDGYLSLAGRVTAGHINSFLSATEDYTVEALQAACRDFQRGDVPGYDPAYPLTAPQLARRCETWEVALRRLNGQREPDGIVAYPIGALPPAGTTPLGPIKLEIDGRIRDVSALTHEQKEEVMRTGKLPDPVTPTIQRIANE